jgi:osmotically inducible protein OsmC
MAVRSATAVWNGTLKEGEGNLSLQSGAFSGKYSFSTRFEDGVGTNPEELLGAAHAACYSMALNNSLHQAGTPATSVSTVAKVHLTKGEKGSVISKIELVVEAVVPNISQEDFMAKAEATKSGCIISQALSAVPMELHATLKSE